MARNHCRSDCDMLLYEISFGGLDVLYCSTQSAFGEECARWFERPKSPQHDATATLAGGLRKDKKIPKN